MSPFFMSPFFFPDTAAAFTTHTAADGSFVLKGIPQSSLVEVKIASQRSAPATIAWNTAQPGNITLDRLVTLTGRVIDAQTGKGVANITVASYHIENMYRKEMRSAEIDAEGRYSVLAQPGTVHIEAEGLPKSYLSPMPEEYPNSEVKADRDVPHLKLTHAIGLAGIVVDQAGQPVPSAEVYFLFTPDRRWTRRDEPMRTGPDGTFHFDQLNPDDKTRLWARAGDATSNGTIVVKPSHGKVTLTVDPKNAVRLRGLATDGGGQRIAGAKVSLRWTRACPPAKEGRTMMWTSSVQETYTTSENGLFVFRNLWPEDRYHVVVEARGHNNGESPKLTAKVGETHDLGKIVLINTDARIAGRVVGSDGRPIVGAEVFNRGDAPGPVAKSTDSQGRFRLDGMLPGNRFVFDRKEGYRFTGVKSQGESDGMWFSEDDLRRDPESGETTGARGDCAVHLRKRLSVGLRRIEAPVLVG
jgi:Carboxypeptidase regulatory-like domain